MTDFTLNKAVPNDKPGDRHESGKLMTASQVERETKGKRHSPRTQDEFGVNHGGSCLGCGGPLQFWFNYQVCDKCLVIREGAVYQA